MEGGLNPATPVAVIEKGTSALQRTITGRIDTIVKEAEAAKVQPPAVIVIGKVVSLGRKLSWFKTNPR